MIMTTDIEDTKIRKLDYDLNKDAQGNITMSPKTTSSVWKDDKGNYGGALYEEITAHLRAKLNRYREALEWIVIRSGHGWQSVPEDVQQKAKQALSEE